MKNFLIGLGIGLAGMITWVLFSVLIGLGQAGQSEVPVWITAFSIIGFAVMFLGPGYFWIFLPLRSRFTRRSPGRT